MRARVTVWLDKTLPQQQPTVNKTDGEAEGLNSLFECEVEIPRMRHGSRQSLDTLINEEATLLAQYLRNEHDSWFPRIAKRS